MKVDKPASWRELMSIKQVSNDTFQSLLPAYSPGSLPSVGKRAFGGHVHAQSVWSASQTVEDGFHVHNITGHFVLPGMVEDPFLFKVKKIRDGGSYCLRFVEVFQRSEVAAEGKVPCFVATISFKRKENNHNLYAYGHQDAPCDHIQREYSIVLRGKKITDHPLAPSADADWSFLDDRSNLFPGCEIRKVDMNAYNGDAVQGGGKDGENITNWRQLLFYKMILDDDHRADEDSLNLHAAAHTYASDRNSLFMVLRGLGYDNNLSFMGSLSHTVIFHGPHESIRMTDDKGYPKWFVQEAWTTNSGDNRVCHNSRLWDYSNGSIIATTMQDGMMRLPIEPKQLKL